MKNASPTLSEDRIYKSYSSLHLKSLNLIIHLGHNQWHQTNGNLKFQLKHWLISSLSVSLFYSRMWNACWFFSLLLKAVKYKRGRSGSQGTKVVCVGGISECRSELRTLQGQFSPWEASKSISRTHTGREKKRVLMETDLPSVGGRGLKGVWNRVGHESWGED